MHARLHGQAVWEDDSQLRAERIKPPWERMTKDVTLIGYGDDEAMMRVAATIEEIEWKPSWLMQRGSRNRQLLGASIRPQTGFFEKATFLATLHVLLILALARVCVSRKKEKWPRKNKMTTTVVVADRFAAKLMSPREP